MVLSGDRAERGEDRRERKHACTEIRVEPHPLQLSLGELSWLVPDGVRDSEAPDVVYEPGSAECRHVVSWQPVGERGRRGEIRHTGRFIGLAGGLELRDGVENTGGHPLQRGAQGHVHKQRLPGLASQRRPVRDRLRVAAGRHPLLRPRRTPGGQLALLDDDSGRTNARREATYLGAAHFVEQTATSLAPLLFVVLRLFGDTRADSFGIRLAGPVAGVIVFSGYLLFRRYNLPDDVSARVEPEAVVALP